MMLPWFIRRTVSAFRTAYYRRKPVFQGVYSSFSDISYDGWFEGPEWVRRAVAAVRVARSETPHLIPSTLSQSKAMLAVVAAPFLATRGKVRILDFGGAAGADFANLLNCIGGAAIDYVVVDSKPLCEAGREEWRGDQRISFREDMPPDGERFDIVYSCSSLQYVERYAELLARFASYRPDAMLFVRHCFANRTFARKQINRGSMPEWVYGLNEIELLMRSFGYKLGMKVFSEDDFNADNYGPEYRVEHSANLLFVKDGVSK